MGEKRVRIEFTIYPDFFLTAAAAAFICSGELIAYTVFAVLIHESAHIIMLCICGGAVAKVSLSCFGISIIRAEYPVLSYGRELCCLVFGCVANFAAYLLLKSTLPEAATVNLILGIYNICPAACLDGGHIVYLIFKYIGKERTGEIILAITGIVLSAVIIALSIYAIDRYGFNAGVFFTSGIFVFGIFKEYLSDKRKSLSGNFLK